MPNYANGFVTADGTTYQIIPPAAQSAQLGGITAEGTEEGVVYIEAVMGPGGKIYIPVANNTTTTEEGFAADARALADLKSSLRTSRILYRGDIASPTDGTLELPRTPTGTNSTMTFTCSIPAGATLMGAQVSSSTLAAAILSWGASQTNSSVSVRAYNVATTQIVTWSQIIVRPIFCFLEN